MIYINSNRSLIKNTMRLVAVLTVLILAAGKSSAETISVTFYATITSSITTTASIGDRIEAAFVYESGTAGSPAGYYNGAISGFSMSLVTNFGLPSQNTQSIWSNGVGNIFIDESENEIAWLLEDGTDFSGFGFDDMVGLNQNSLLQATSIMLNETDILSIVTTPATGSVNVAAYNIDVAFHIDNFAVASIPLPAAFVFYLSSATVLFTLRHRISS